MREYEGKWRGKGGGIIRGNLQGCMVSVEDAEGKNLKVGAIQHRRERLEIR